MEGEVGVFEERHTLGKGRTWHEDRELVACGGGWGPG